MVATEKIGRKLARKRAHKSVEPLEYTTPTQTQPMTGAEAVAYWQALPGASVFADPKRFPQDSPQLARLLRKQAETRE